MTEILEPQRDRDRAVAEYRSVRRWGWWYVAEHRIRAMRNYIGSLFIIGIGSPVMYLLGLGAGLGVLVNQNQGDNAVDGVGYLQFIAPALLLAGVMVTSAQESTFGVFGGFKWTPIFLGMRDTALTPAQIVTGFALGTMVRYVPAACFYMLAMYAFGIISGWGGLLMVPIAMLLGTSISMAVMAWVSTQRNDRGQLSFVERFVMTPLTLFSGTYFPLETLHEGLHWVGWISPLWHTAELGRLATYGSEQAFWLTVVHILYPVALAAMGWLLSVRHFKKRLTS